MIAAASTLAWTGTAGALQIGAETRDDLLAAASAVDRCGMSVNEFAAMMLALTFLEAGAKTDTSPSPMTLSRWDNQAGLYAFGDPATPYQRAFFHPGVGMFQLDSAGLGQPVGADEAISTDTAAEVIAASLSAGYCGAGGSPADRRRAAWKPWYACASGGCEPIYQKLSAGGGLMVTVDAVPRTGGMEARTCNRGGVSFTCWFVDPAKALGFTGWADPQQWSGMSPLTLPFYTFVGDQGEERHWLPADTGYDRAIMAVRPLDRDARYGLQWSFGDDLAVGEAAPPPPPPQAAIGSVDLVQSTLTGLRVAGWAEDPDRADSASAVVVSVDGQEQTFVAGNARADVGTHGFDVQLPAPLGARSVQVRAGKQDGSASTPLYDATVQVTVGGDAGLQRLAGDFDGDGHPDLVVIDGHGGGGPARLVVARANGSGGGEPYDPPASWWLAQEPGEWDWSRAKPVVGDFTGDGKADIGAVYDYGRAFTKFWVFASTGSSFARPVEWWSTQRPGRWEWSWIDPLAAGDLTGDGRADLRVGYARGTADAATWVFTSTAGPALTPPVRLPADSAINLP